MVFCRQPSIARRTCPLWLDKVRPGIMTELLKALHDAILMLGDYRTFTSVYNLFATCAIGCTPAATTTSKATVMPSCAATALMRP